MAQFLALIHPKNWLVWLAMGVLRLVTLLPLKAQFKLGSWFGGMLYKIAPSRRRVVEINIALCFPEKSPEQQQALVKQHFYSLGVMLPEMGLSWWASERRLSSLVEIEGLEFLVQALSQDRGVLLLGAHFTTLEIGLFLLSAETQMPICGMYRPHKNAVIEFFMRRGRERYLNELIPRDDIRGLIRSLKQNKLVWYAPDQVYQDKGWQMIPFFGVPASTNLSTSRIAKLSKASVIPFASYRKANGEGYKLVIKAPLSDFPSDDEIADATRMHQVFEESIRQQPAQYFWIHKRFKNRNDRSLDQYFLHNEKN